MIRYCDDFVVCCERKEDAERFIIELEERLSKFNLNISKEKTSIVNFGRDAWYAYEQGGDRVPTFNFLGFTHYCTKSQRGKFIMGHKTQKEKLSKGLKELNLWLKRIRNIYPLEIWWKMVGKKLVGHYNYFGISGNMRYLRKYYAKARRIPFKWINRRSQKNSMTKEEYLRYLEYNPLPQPRIYHNMYTLSPRR